MELDRSLVTFGSWYVQFKGWNRIFLSVASIFVIVSSAFLWSISSRYFTFFVILESISLIVLYSWTCMSPSGLPIFPAFVVQNSVVYGLPVILGNSSLEVYGDDVILPSCLSVGVFLVSLLVGYAWGRKPKWGAFASHPLFPEGRSVRDGLASVGLLLLLISIVLYYCLYNLKFIYVVPASVVPVFNSMQSVLIVIGSFLGAFCRPGTSKSYLIYTMCFGFFLQSISSFLLSPCFPQVLAFGAGLFISSNRFPLIYTCLILIVLSFLSLGKFAMRDRVANSYIANDMGFIEIYSVWFSESYDALMARQSGDVDKGGQSLLSRLNNTQNLFFVVDRVALKGYACLYGESYMGIPSLLIPRFVWPDKPRTHQGQVTLNLHFERQANLAETYSTYIAWGLLPEAIGNFGIVFGSLFIGLLCGFFSAATEVWSKSQLIFSIEGLVSTVVLLQFLLTFEQVASVAITSLFQTLVVTLVVGIAARLVFFRDAHA